MTERDLNITEKKIYLEIGNKISLKRKSSRKKIQGVSKKLNISQCYIENIEKGQLEKVPNHIPIKGFIKSYAKLIGVDITKEISMIEELALVNNGKLIREINKKSLSKINFFYLLLGFVILFLFLFFFFSEDNQKKLNEKNNPYGYNQKIIYYKI
tara:strand:- start:129 stop:593 length:465 start_codon:yes stop_codon:yes gene_type:complete